MKLTRRTLVGLSLAIVAVSLAVFELYWVVTAIAFGALLGCIMFLAFTADRLEQQVRGLQPLQAAYDELDQQAKVVIRTDLELHRIQEELDRKLDAVVALHALGQELKVTVQPNEVYGKLTAHVVTTLGFSKGLIGLAGSDGQLQWQSAIGIDERAADQIRQRLSHSDWLQRLLAQPSPRTFVQGATTEATAAALLELCGAATLVAAGVVPQAGPSGCVLLARQTAGPSEARGDEELVAILATQLTIAVENSAFYEERWRAEQALEGKVQERTRELAQANEQLIRLNKAKSDFVSAVSHELRTPLAAIKGYASLLHGGQFGPLEPPQAERLAKIERHADLLTNLINNLLDIARIESGRVTMASAPISAQDLLATVLDVIKPQMDAKRIRLTTQLDGVTHLPGDPTHLPRVFVNLLSNAVKYTPEGGAITVSVERRPGQIVASVRDTGCGIAPEELPKLFQEFYRTANPINEHVRGTGLGLALVKRIVEAHRGTIWVTSEPGAGSTFAFSLPT